MLNRITIAVLLFGLFAGARQATADEQAPLFSRHVEAVFSRLGCNGGTCHGTVQGQNGFKLTLFAADPALDYARILRDAGGRRIDRIDPDASLLLQKAIGKMPHGGGMVTHAGSREYDIIRRWIASGAELDSVEKSVNPRLRVIPAEKLLKPDESYSLKVEADFPDGTVDVTALCSFESHDRNIATIDGNGVVRAVGIGDAALIVRYRAEPTVAIAMVPRPSPEAFPTVKGNNFIDVRILEKLKRLNIPPAAEVDDATFLRRATLDVTGELPTSKEVREFIADKSSDKRTRKIDELLKRPGYAALWTLKFCDMLKASDFGVRSDGVDPEHDAPRFQRWVRARLDENTPYDVFVERILTATSREGRTIDDWSKEVIGLFVGFDAKNSDLDLYAKRKTLDLYWQRKGAVGVSGTLQVAHTFLGLRLECAQCHRHPHDVWQQDDLLSFSNFLMRVRLAGFTDANVKKFPEVAEFTKKLTEESKKVAEEVKKQRASPKWKELEAEAKKAKLEEGKVALEIAKLERLGDKLDAAGKTKVAELRKTLEKYKAAQKEFATFSADVTAMSEKITSYPEVVKRMLNSQILHMVEDKPTPASVTSALGTQSSSRFRLLGEANAIDIPKEKDPREVLVEWLRRPDNPFFAKAIVNRVWAHYFGRGIVDPPDNLSPLNPASHPELLKELADGFIANHYDLKWLHRTILASRTYQQSSQATPANTMDRSNYAYFYNRRLPVEVLLDVLNQATETSEQMKMNYYHWPENLKTVELPFAPKNDFVTFMFDQFGKPARNPASQCDCERDSGVSILQAMSLVNHPRIWQKIDDPKGRVARIIREVKDEQGRIDELFLSTLSRLPNESEKQACAKYMKSAETPTKGLQGVMWTVINTREFLLQH